MHIWIIGFGLLIVLIVLSIVDFQKMILPNFLTLPLIGSGLLFAHWQDVFRASLIGVIVGYVGLVGLELFYKKVKGVDGIGRGDAKLLAAGGAWCGWYGLSFIILIASASGLIHALLISKSKESKTINKLPFGPHLALGIFITWLALFVLN